jgi:hypothetical protein
VNLDIGQRKLQEMLDIQIDGYVPTEFYFVVIRKRATLCPFQTVDLENNFPGSRHSDFNFPFELKNPCFLCGLQ